MKLKLFNKFRSHTSQKSLVLMYHRIASPYSDVWEISVSANRFEQQLKVLQRKMKIVSLEELIATSHLSGNKAAITFDDGYIDNFEVVKPILEQYQIPATFFITSKQDEIDNVYWWDILENCILCAEQLPPAFELFANDFPQSFNLKDEVRLTEQMKKNHSAWKACVQPPPTIRAKLFLALWQYLKPLPHEQQQQHINELKNWCGFHETANADYRVMSASQLNELSRNSLFTIGAHTATHPALGQHSAAFQKKEMTENRQYLQQVVNRDIQFLAYPYGSFNSDTLNSAWELGFNAAFTTEEKAVDTSNKYKLGRFHVKNVTGDEFDTILTKWIA